ncbi:MAG: TIM barrel protein, partial [Clostridia bacterium]|nr:TIM barrel protein [Clostridia bacterium]
GVEFAGNYGGYSAKDLVKLCDEIGLKILSTHSGFDCFLNDFDGTVNYLSDLGVSYSAIPWMPADKIPGTEGFAEMRDLFIKMQAALENKGIRLLYHNHDFEYVTLPEGGFAYDKLLAEVPGMWPEFDVCWVTYSGNDPVEYIKKYSDKISVVHLKDFEGGKSSSPAYALIDADGNEIKAEAEEPVNTFKFRPVGSGIVKIKDVIDTAIAYGAKSFIVEQDDCYGDCFGAAEQSRAYLKSLGL